MYKTLVFGIIVLITFSQCGESPSGKPTDKVVYVNKTEGKKEVEAKAKDSVSSMDETQLAKAKEIIASVTDKSMQAVKAKKIFKTNCASCHGFTGNLGVNGAKDLSKSTISLEEAVAQVFHGRGLMLPYKDVLSSVELVAVSKYAETLRK